MELKEEDGSLVPKEYVISELIAVMYQHPTLPY
jgi:hypothetical protein